MHIDEYSPTLLVVPNDLRHIGRSIRSINDRAYSTKARAPSRHSQDSSFFLFLPISSLPLSFSLSLSLSFKRNIFRIRSTYARPRAEYLVARGTNSMWSSPSEIFVPCSQFLPEIPESSHSEQSLESSLHTNRVLHDPQKNVRSQTKRR